MVYLTQCYTLYTSSRGHIIRIKTRTIFKIIETYGILLYLIRTQIAILFIQGCTNSWYKVAYSHIIWFLQPML